MAASTVKHFFRLVIVKSTKDTTRAIVSLKIIPISAFRSRTKSFWKQEVAPPTSRTTNCLQASVFTLLQTISGKVFKERSFILSITSFPVWRDPMFSYQHWTSKLKSQLLSLRHSHHQYQNWTLCRIRRSERPNCVRKLRFWNRLSERYRGLQPPNSSDLLDQLSSDMTVKIHRKALTWYESSN